MPPIHLASTFVQPAAGQWGEFDYSRSGNPTRKALETTLAALESGTGALAFSSGMAAIHCVTALLKPGDHIVAGADIYGGTYRLLHKIVEPAGIGTTLVDATSSAAIEAAIRPQTKLLWIESPGNLLLTISDIAACAKVARKHGVLLGVDSTFATPVLTRPLELGADIVMHSATKYLGGHSDLLGGALVVRDPELFKQLYFIQNATGAVMGPLEAFLCSRGIKTLELRVLGAVPHRGATGRFSGRAPARAARLLSGARESSGPRGRCAANGRRIRRDVVVRDRGRSGRCEARRRWHGIVSIGGELGRRRIANRTTGFDVACELRSDGPRGERDSR